MTLLPRLPSYSYVDTVQVRAQAMAKDWFTHVFPLLDT